LESIKSPGSTYRQALSLIHFADCGKKTSEAGRIAPESKSLAGALGSHYLLFKQTYDRTAFKIAFEMTDPCHFSLIEN
jgi:hypothetical protein